MRRFLVVFSCMITLFLHANNLPLKLSDAITIQLSEPRFNTVSGSIVIEAIHDNSYTRLYEKNLTQLFTPASTIKPILSLAVLNQFGSNYRFNTKIYAGSKIVNGVVSGNIYLKGLGDPSLEFSDIQAMVRQLKHRGIKEINGDLIYDDTYFKVDYVLNPRAARYYSSPPGALSVNSNAVHFMIDESTHLLKPVLNSNYVTYQVDGSVLEDYIRPGYPWPEIFPLPLGDHYVFHGNVTPKDVLSHFLEVLVSRPGMYFASLFYEALNKEGILLKGHIQAGVVSNDDVLLLNYEGKPLKLILQRLNQESNNVIAAMLNLNLAVAQGEVPATKETGLAFLNDFVLKQLKFEDGNFFFEDASGLSIHNKITANEMMRLLRFIYKRKLTRSVLLNSFIKVGDNPEIQQVKVPAFLDVYVKTGTLASRGVNSLIGYLIDKRNGAVYSFCILLDDQEGDAGKGYLTYPILNRIIDCLLYSNEKN